MKYRPDLPKDGWYTYGLFLDGVPFYVGKGSGKRALNHFYPSYMKHGSNPWKNYIINKHRNDIDIIILTTHKDEKDAFSMEEFLISSYGFKKDGGFLVNQTTGGEGSSGAVVSEELKMRRGNSIRKFTDDALWKSLEAYYLEGVNQETAATLLGLHQTQFARVLAGCTKSALDVLLRFQSENPQIDFKNYSKNRIGGNRRPKENT